MYDPALTLLALVKRRGADMHSSMNEGLRRLSEREKETLRLLLGGHDAKSIARSLDISVHTVNERLREARRKMEVTSSREAARLLGQAEQDLPNFHADKQFGDVRLEAGLNKGVQHFGVRRIAMHPLTWLLGGIVIMSLIYAAFMLVPSITVGSNTQATAAAATQAAPDVAQAQLAEDARRWLTIMDGFRWDDSWTQASKYFRSQVTAAEWAAKAEPVRRPLGAVSSRTLKGVQTDVLPKRPLDYAMVQFETSFALPVNTIETVILVREESGWFVAGYTIVPDVKS